MTLLISVFASIISTAVWYFCAERKKYLLNVPCYIFWGASVMGSLMRFLSTPS